MPQFADEQIKRSISLRFGGSRGKQRDVSNIFACGSSCGAMLVELQTRNGDMVTLNLSAAGSELLIRTLLGAMPALHQYQDPEVVKLCRLVAMEPRLVDDATAPEEPGINPAR